MDTVKIGIAGCGVIGKKALNMIKELDDVEVTAVADLRSDLVEATAKEFEVDKFYTSGEELFDDDNVEAVILSLPANARTKLALQAFKKGKHVLTEKPVAMNSGEVEQMIAAQGDLVGACCSSRFSFVGSSQMARRIVAEGTLGDIRLIRTRVIYPAKPPRKPPPPWRLKKSFNGGGVLMNLGSYNLDSIWSVSGWSLKPESVLAQIWSLPDEFAEYAAPDSDAETHCVALIRCSDGITISFEYGEMVCGRSEGAYDFIGTKASLHLPPMPGKNEKIIQVDAVKDQGAVEKILWQGDETWDTGHSGVIRDFAEAVRGEHEPATSLKRSLLIQKITDAIYASAEKGREIVIDSQSSHKSVNSALQPDLL